MKYQMILVEIQESVAVITLNRPERLNAHNLALTDELEDALTELETSDQTGAVVITGAGDKAFCAGADIHELTHLSPEQLILRQQNIMQWTAHIADYCKPVIGAINGLAYGGGALMSSLFDLRIGCERTKFRFLGAAHGRLNSTWTLPMIVGWSRAKDLLFTGRAVEAAEALQIGLLNRLVPADELMKTAMETARTIAANDRRVVRGIKSLLNRNVGVGVHDMVQAEMETVRSLGYRPVEESFKDFLKRKPGRKAKTAGPETKAKTKRSSGAL